MDVGLFNSLSSSQLQFILCYFIIDEHTILEKAQLINCLNGSLTHIHDVLQLNTTPYKHSASRQ